MTGTEPREPEREDRKRKGTVKDRAPDPLEWLVLGLIAFMLVLMIVAVSVAASVLGSFSETVAKVEEGLRKIERVEEENRDTNRATAFRLCTRDMVQRATLHAFIRGANFKGTPVPPQGVEQRAFRLRYSRALMDPAFLPILTCEPNLDGHGARPISLHQQERFMRDLVRRRLSDVERGICPGSRFDETQSQFRC